MTGSSASLAYGSGATVKFIWRPPVGNSWRQTVQPEADSVKQAAAPSVPDVALRDTASPRLAATPRSRDRKLWSAKFGECVSARRADEPNALQRLRVRSCR